MKALMEAVSKMWRIPRNYYGVNLSHKGMHHLKNSECYYPIWILFLSFHYINEFTCTHCYRNFFPGTWSNHHSLKICNKIKNIFFLFRSVFQFFSFLSFYWAAFRLSLLCRLGDFESNQKHKKKYSNCQSIVRET